MVRFKACAVAAAVFAILPCGRLSAQIVWSGSEDNTWSDPLNWVGTPLFDGTDQLAFNSEVSMTSDVNHDYSITSLTVASGSGPLLLESNEGSVLTFSSSFIDSSANAVSVTLSLSGSGYVLSNGNGILTLSGNNTYTGGTTIDSGTLAVGSNSALGSGTLMLSSGTNLTTTGSGCFTIGNDITLCGGGNVTLLGGSLGSMLELNGTISGAGGLDIAAATDGQNIVTLTSDGSTFGGGVTVDSGNTELVVGASSTGTAGAVTSGPLGTGMLMLSNGNDLTTLDGHSYTIGNDITFCGGGTVTLLGGYGGNNGTSLELDGAISGSSAIEVVAPGSEEGPNSVVLTSPNSTFSGGVRVDSGFTSIKVGASSTGTGSSVTQGPLGTGTLMLGDGTDFDTTANGCFTIGNNLTLCGTGTVYVFAANGGNMLTLSGMISGSPALEVGYATSNNYLALTSGCSTFSGGVRVEGGSTTLAVGASSSGTGSSVTQGPLGTGTLMLSDGNNFTTIDSSCYTIGNDITLCGEGTVTLLGNGMGKMLMLTGMIYGSANLEIAPPGCSGSNTVTLTSGCSTFSGGVTVDSGNTTLVVGASGSGSPGDVSSGPLGTGSLTLGGGSTLTTPMCTPETVLNNISIGDGVAFGSTYESGMSGMLSLLGVISDYSGPASLVINGPVDLEGCNTYSGGTTINYTTVTVGTNTGLGTGAVTAYGSTLNFNSSSPVINDPTFSSTTVNFAANSTPTIIGMSSDSPGSTNVINLGPADSTTTLTIQVDADPAYYGSITGYGNVSVTSASSGELDLRGANTYVGQTTIGSHTLVVAGNNAAFGTGPVTVNTGGVLGLDTGITVSNQITLGDGGNIGGYGTIAPGSPETITFENGSGLTGGRGALGAGDSSHPVVGTLSFGPNATLNFGGGGGLQFSIMNAAGTAGVDYSTINVAGALNVSATPLNQFTIQLVGVDSTGQLVGTANTFSASQTYSWTLLSAGSITNFNAGAFAFDSSNFFSNPTSSGTFFVSQSGNDLMLNFTPVPEPSTWALMVSGVFALGAAFRRRRR